MSDITRRTFFKQAGVVAATAGAVAVVPGTIAPSSAAATTKPLSVEEVGAAEPIVAHLTDAQKGSITLFVGTREVHIHDREVVARIVRAAR
jgi:hypothetical protein